MVNNVHVGGKTAFGPSAGSWFLFLVDGGKNVQTYLCNCPKADQFYRKGVFPWVSSSRFSLSNAHCILEPTAALQLTFLPN